MNNNKKEALKNKIDEYNNYYKSLINNDEFKECKNNNGKVYYTYKQFVIDVKFDDEEDETYISDTFEPFYKPSFYQIIGNINQIQYDRPVLLFDYKNDIIKYKNDIIKYIDNKLYEEDD